MDRERSFQDDQIQTDSGRYGIGGETGPGRFGTMPTGIVAVGEDINDTTPLDKGRRAGMSIVRNQTTRPQQRYNERR